jgi:hypothetical protein
MPTGMNPEATLQTAMGALVELANESNAASMGFASLQEVRSAKAGEPVMLRILGYDRMLGFQGGFPLEDLFEREVQAVYPLEVDERPRSSVVLTRADDRWLIASIGDRSMVEALEMVRDRRQSGAELEIVSAPGVNLEVLKVTRAGISTLVSVRDYPRLGWTKGAELDWAEGVKAIVTYTNEFDAEYGLQVRERRLSR